MTQIHFTLDKDELQELISNSGANEASKLILTKLFNELMENQRDVIVVAGEGFNNRAIFGDIMGSVALSKGVVGVVVNGSIRDVKEL